MDHVVQPALAVLAIALSVFSLITYLWLGTTVLLMGNRRSAITWVGGLGLLLAALFFLCHGAMVGAGFPIGPSPTDFWWHLSWVPGFAAPIFWAAIGLHYVGLAQAWRSFRLPLLAAVAVPGAVAALLALLNWRVIGTYGDFIRLLGSALRLRAPAPPLAGATSPALPALGLAFVIYVAACACLPWASLMGRRPLPSTESASVTGADAALLWDAADAWSRARTALLGASVCMMGAGAVAALLGVLASLAVRGTLQQVSPSLGPVLPASPPGHVPLVLVLADLAVQSCLAALGLLIGWAVVRQGVLVERRLPQRGFLSHWRGTALVASLLAAVVAWMAAVEAEALPDLLVLVTLVTVIYALFTWQSYGEHDRLLAQLRPFIASLSVARAGWLAGDPSEVERHVEALFTSLCRDVLGAARGRLSITAGRFHRSYTYTAPADAIAQSGDDREWSLPVADERGVVAQLVLGPRSDGAGYTSADLEVARACGQRILDAVGEFAAAQAVASLARRRGLEAELSAALPRRVLHDEVLPRLHLAMLRLEALKSHVGLPVAVTTAVTTAAPADATAESPDLRADLGAVVQELGHAHHDLAALMRATPAANPRRLEHGLVAVLHSSLDGEFRGSFDTLEWDAAPAAAAAADALPAIVADLLLGAAQEAVRNAGRHARGDDLHRRLTLRVALAADDRWVTVTVADDGVGLQNEAVRTAKDEALPPGPDASSPFLAPPPGRNGTRSGLLTHGALLALIGGVLSVRSQPTRGTTVTIRVPRASDLTADAGVARA
jgi:histidine kinase/DNA gyrase B/HSP90-like ATPase